MICETDRRIRDSVLLTRRTDSGIFQVLTCEDGGYDLAWDGEVLGCFHWKGDELDDCLAALDRLAKADAPKLVS